MGLNPAHVADSVSSHRKAPAYGSTIPGEHHASVKEEGVPEFPAITHVALTVTSLERSVPWYKALFGSEPVLDEDTGPFHHVVWLMGGTLVGIHQFPDLISTEPFDERRPGLDHLAFACASRTELEAWESRLNELGIANGGIVDAPYGSGLSFRDPDNIALEFFSPPG
jgi:glyoxylase I family protein